MMQLTHGTTTTEWHKAGAGEHITLIHGAGASMEGRDGVIDVLASGYPGEDR